jgi:RNase P protein component
LSVGEFQQQNPQRKSTQSKAAFFYFHPVVVVAAFKIFPSEDKTIISRATQRNETKREVKTVIRLDVNAT